MDTVGNFAVRFYTPAPDGLGSFTPTLTITDIRPSDAGRYWCAPDVADDYSYLGDLERGAQSVVIIVDGMSLYFLRRA